MKIPGTAFGSLSEPVTTHVAKTCASAYDSAVVVPHGELHSTMPSDIIFGEVSLATGLMRCATSVGVVASRFSHCLMLVHVMQQHVRCRDGTCYQ